MLYLWSLEMFDGKEIRPQKDARSVPLPEGHLQLADSSSSRVDLHRLVHTGCRTQELHRRV